MEYEVTAAILFDEDGEAYQMTAYIDEDGKVLLPDNTEPPVGSIVWRNRKIFKISKTGEVQIPEADLPSPRHIRGKLIDKHSR